MKESTNELLKKIKINFMVIFTSMVYMLFITQNYVGIINALNQKFFSILLELNNAKIPELFFLIFGMKMGKKANKSKTLILKFLK